MYDIKRIYEPHTVEEAVKFLTEDNEAIVINGGSDVLNYEIGRASCRERV